MCATRTLTAGPVMCEVIRRVASCCLPAVRPAATPVICSAARCILLACGRASQHEQ